jgi:uncharacterized protein (DUF305 family)
MRTTHPRWRLALLAASIGTLVLAGCGGGETPDTPDTAVTSAPPARISPVPSDASYNAADVVFAQEILINLTRATEMARMAKDRATRAEIKALAAKAEKDREPGLILLPRWFEEHHQPMPETSPRAGQGGGTASAEDMAALANAQGADFDRLFLQTMIKNDEAAANLLTAQQWSGMHAPMMSLAHKLTDDQRVEISELRRLLGR